jgi:glycosyltransferase involved in cell wall biosynthesis
MDEYECPPEKAVLVYAGSNAQVSPKKKAIADYAQPSILFIGLDWQRKGGPDLVEAFQLVRRGYPEAQLTIVGANPDLNLPGCHVVGKVPPEELDRYYQAASIFCLPTYVEPFGIVFIEAMNAHLPIVATRLGAIPDFVTEGRNGIMVEPGDIPGLANALLLLLRNPALCHSFGEYSSRLVRDRYSWEAVGEKIKQNILRVLGELDPLRYRDLVNMEEMQQ